MSAGRINLSSYFKKPKKAEGGGRTRNPRNESVDFDMTALSRSNSKNHFKPTGDSKTIKELKDDMEFGIADPFLKIPDPNISMLGRGGRARNSRKNDMDFEFANAFPKSLDSRWLDSKREDLRTLPVLEGGTRSSRRDDMDFSIANAFSKRPDSRSTSMAYAFSSSRSDHRNLPKDVFPTPLGNFESSDIGDAFIDDVNGQGAIGTRNNHEDDFVQRSLIENQGLWNTSHEPILDQRGHTEHDFDVSRQSFDRPHARSRHSRKISGEVSLDIARLSPQKPLLSYKCGSGLLSETESKLTRNLALYYGIATFH
ncbi:hypothetical protein BC829DRAFT_440528 [Chytridium lagenaria]|nr:hypothetical protein BC829DRAFT_440528 [Chytridium lagenaria]